MLFDWVSHNKTHNVIFKHAINQTFSGLTIMKYIIYFTNITIPILYVVYSCPSSQINNNYLIL